MVSAKTSKETRGTAEPVYSICNKKNILPLMFYLKTVYNFIMYFEKKIKKTFLQFTFKLKLLNKLVNVK